MKYYRKENIDKKERLEEESIQAKQHEKDMKSFKKMIYKRFGEYDKRNIELFRDQVSGSKWNGFSVEKRKLGEKRLLLGLTMNTKDALKIIDEVLFEHEQNSKG